MRREQKNRAVGKDLKYEVKKMRNTRAYLCSKRNDLAERKRLVKHE